MSLRSADATAQDPLRRHSPQLENRGASVPRLFAILRPLLLAGIAAIALACASDAHALRLVDYSLEDYPHDGSG